MRRQKSIHSKRTFASRLKLFPRTRTVRADSGCYPRGTRRDGANRRHGRLTPTAAGLEQGPGITVASLCKQMTDRVLREGVALSSNGVVSQNDAAPRSAMAAPLIAARQRVSR